MLSQYLLIYSEAIKATIKEIKAKTQNRLFYDPSLTHKGGSGGKTDGLFRLSIYAFPIPLNTFWSYKSNNKGDIRQKLQSSYFMTPVWPMGGQGVKLTGYLDSPHMLSQYLLICSEAIKATIKEIKAKTQNQLFYDPSLTHKEGLGGKTDRLFRFSTYAFPIPLNIFWSYKSNNKGDKGKNSKAAILWPQFDP